MSINLNGFWQSWDVVSGNTAATNEYEFWKGMVMSNGQVLNNQFDFFTYHNTTRYEWFKALQGTYPEVWDEYTFYANTNDPRIYDFYTFYKYCGEYLVQAVTPTPTPTNTPTPTPTPSPAPFTPASISNLVGWFDAGQGVTTTGGKVDVWDDLSNSMGDFRYVTGSIGAKGDYNATGFGTNNLPYIHGYNGGTYTTASNWSTTTNSTVYVVCSFYQTVGGLYQGYMEQSGYGTGFIFMDVDGSANDLVQFGFTSNLVGSANFNPLLNTPSVLRAKWNGTTNLIKLNNGTEVSTGSVLASQPSNKLYLFNRANTNFGAGFDVAEIIIYNKVLDATETTNLENYISTKYGINLGPDPTPTPTPTATNTPTPTPTPSPAPTLLLDSYPNAAFGLSVRKLRSAYTGNAIRVRRSSDNTEQDIGFNGVDLDTTSLLSFVGAGNNGFVVTWYDQSTNGRDFTQSNQSLQPQIVQNGSVLTLTGIGSAKPQLYLDGNDFLIGPNLSSYTEASIFTSTISRTGGGATFWDFNDDQGGATHHPFQTNDAYEGAFKTNRPQVIVPNNSLLSLHIWGVTSASNDYKVSLNNSNVYTSASSTVRTTITNPHLGMSSPVTANGYQGSFQEVIVWYSNQDSNRTGIINNMNNYFGVFV